MSCMHTALPGAGMEAIRLLEKYSAPLLIGLSVALLVSVGSVL
jgi:hypothetical protein